MSRTQTHKRRDEARGQEKLRESGTYLHRLEEGRYAGMRQSAHNLRFPVQIFYDVILLDRRNIHYFDSNLK